MSRNELALAPTSLPNTPPLEFIAAAAAAGFDSLGLRLHKSPAYPNWFPIVGNAPLMRDVKRAVADSGLRMLDVFTFYLQPETDLDAMAEAMGYGAELGARYAQLIGDDPDWARMTDNFGQFCDVAARHGLVAAIEAPVNSRTVNSVPLARKLIADAGRANAALVLDPLQFFRSRDDVSVLEDARIFAYTQFNDGPLSGPRMEPGHGRGAAATDPRYPPTRATDQRRVVRTRRIRRARPGVGRKSAGEHPTLSGGLRLRSLIRHRRQNAWQPPFRDALPNGFVPCAIPRWKRIETRHAVRIERQLRPHSRQPSAARTSRDLRRAVD